MNSSWPHLEPFRPDHNSCKHFRWVPLTPGQLPWYWNNRVSLFSLATRCTAAHKPRADWSFHLSIKRISLDNRAKLGATETLSSMSPDGDKEHFIWKSVASAKISNKVRHTLNFEYSYMLIPCRWKSCFTARFIATRHWNSTDDQGLCWNERISAALKGYNLIFKVYICFYAPKY